MTTSAEILRGRAQDLRRWAMATTVPIGFFSGEPSFETQAGVGSAIPVALNDHVFLLTAGHVVKAAKNAAVVSVGILLSKHMYVLDPLIVRSAGFRFAGACNADYGFIRIPKSEDARFRHFDKRTVGDGRLHVVAPHQLTTDESIHLLAGYPGCKAETADPAGRGNRCLYVATCAAGCAGLPSSIGYLAPPNGPLNYFDLCISQEHLREATDPDYPPFDLEKLKGMSGGGVWLASSSLVGLEDWTTDSLRLAALHSSSVRAHADGEDVIFSREVSVGHHLKLIGDTCSDLRDYILRTWPVVASY